MASTRALVLGLVLVACSGSSSSPIDPPAESSGALRSPGSSRTGAPGSAGTPAPPVATDTGHVTPPPPPPPVVAGLEVSATIIAATLGDDCLLAERFAGLCAPTPDGGGCGLPCQQSNLQLSFKTGAGEGKSAKIAITSVALHDAKNGTKLDTLTASAPKSWMGNGYGAWDETLKASSDLKATYDLSAPNWSKIGGQFLGEYRLLVTLDIDGTLVTLESTILSREPPVAT
jgi:hypothetical protein